MVSQTLLAHTEVLRKSNLAIAVLSLAAGFSLTLSVNCVNILLGFEAIRTVKIELKLQNVATFITARIVFTEFSCTSILERVTSESKKIRKFQKIWLKLK